eukprot:1139692-Pelagomonas_calceolata.AAC.5
MDAGNLLKPMLGRGELRCIDNLLKPVLGRGELRCIGGGELRHLWIQRLQSRWPPFRTTAGLGIDGYMCPVAEGGGIVRCWEMEGLEGPERLVAL